MMPSAAAILVLFALLFYVMRVAILVWVGRAIGACPVVLSEGVRYRQIAVMAGIWSYPGLLALAAWLPGLATCLPIRALASPAVTALGGATLGLALLTYAVAARTLGTSYRLGLDSRDSGPLVTRGVYRFVRHPMYTSQVLIGLGGFLAHPCLLTAAGAVLLAVTAHRLARGDERFLQARFGPAYAEYAAGRRPTAPECDACAALARGGMRTGRRGPLAPHGQHRLVCLRCHAAVPSSAGSGWAHHRRRHATWVPAEAFQELDVAR
jgi:protein-S-isoprenylcysteine O-methyltransferase Ste14